MLLWFEIIRDHAPFFFPFYIRGSTILRGGNIVLFKFGRFFQSALGLVENLRLQGATKLVSLTWKQKRCRIITLPSWAQAALFFFLLDFCDKPTSITCEKKKKARMPLPVSSCVGYQSFRVPPLHCYCIHNPHNDIRRFSIWNAGCRDRSSVIVGPRGYFPEPEPTATVAFLISCINQQK